MLTLFQNPDGSIDLAIKHGRRRHVHHFTPDKAEEFHRQFRSFLSSQQSPPYWSTV